jgi:hypothetical protein
MKMAWLLKAAPLQFPRNGKIPELLLYVVLLKVCVNWQEEIVCCGAKLTF